MKQPIHHRIAVFIKDYCNDNKINPQKTPPMLTFYQLEDKEGESSLNFTIPKAIEDITENEWSQLITSLRPFMAKEYGFTDFILWAAVSGIEKEDSLLCFYSVGTDVDAISMSNDFELIDVMPREFTYGFFTPTC